jgi:hypothetical protein
LVYQVNIAALDHRYENFEFGQQQHDWPIHMIVDKRKLDAERSALASSPRSTGGGARSSASGLSTGAKAGIAVCAVVLAACIALLAFMAMREKAGRPVFAPFKGVDDVPPMGSKRANIV